MDEKEKELEARISGSFAFFSLTLPFDRGNKTTSEKSQSVQLEESLITPFGGARSFSGIKEWEQSLENPLTWGVIEVRHDLALPLT